MSKTHPPPKHLDLKNALHEERHLLEDADVPIITVSATFRKELIAKHRTLARPTSEAIFSRAHYSMARAVAQQAAVSGKTSHLVDPTNFVGPSEWKKIDFTENVGQQMARHKSLKWLKDKIDTFARSKLPITAAITPPLHYLTEHITKPIISLHYEAGNLVAAKGKQIIQVLTDPHVRPQYLAPLPNVSSAKPSKAFGSRNGRIGSLREAVNASEGLDPLPSVNQSSTSNTKNQKLNSEIFYCVFDQQTKSDLISTAKEFNKIISSENIIITGPPVDPRITMLAKNKKILSKNQPINIGITTGGLGTNLNEIKRLLTEFTPFLKPPERLRLFLYAGNHRDFRDFFEDFAAQNALRIGNLDDETAPVRILYEDSIIDANENLIKYLFPWAHGIITKPSGDMAYDAAAAGCFLLFLEPWGEWEQNIQNIFTKNSVAFDLKVNSAHKHFSHLLAKSSLRKAQTNAINLPSLFRSGTKNIIALHTRLS